ncbi:MAG TPA: hypothetical protein DEQ09_06620 [Bacteroidales bacterium]|nr:hypothetical protein [Bacteroidales bacterium]
MSDYNRIINKLRVFKPEIENRESLKESVMDRIGNEQSRPDYFFWWTEIRWLRRSMTIAASVIIGIFIIQQVLIANRIDKLEGRMISINTEKILEMQRENVIVNSVVMKNKEASRFADSILVSRDDLLSLIREYRMLQEKYDGIVGSEINSEQNSIKQKL